jgi:murein DD-endopeptidase MepM/ murein hydrolase activator NlpD
VAHVVRPGETLWTISRSHGVTVERLRAANQLPAGGSIRVGQRLAIPGGVPWPDRQEPPSPAEIVLGPPPDVPGVTLTWPVLGPVVSAFGPRGRVWHGGLDLRAERGTPVRAAAPGMVVTSGWERGYGNVVKMWHHHDLMTVYAHNQENLVRVGDWVEQGQVVARVGSTGRSTAPHLHFEIRLAGQKYDPRFWLGQPGVVEAAAWPPDRPVR